MVTSEGRWLGGGGVTSSQTPSLQMSRSAPPAGNGTVEHDGTALLRGPTPPIARPDRWSTERGRGRWVLSRPWTKSLAEQQPTFSVVSCWRTRLTTQSVIAHPPEDALGSVQIGRAHV